MGGRTLNKIQYASPVRIGAAGSEANEWASKRAGQTWLPRETSSECTPGLPGNDCCLLWPLYLLWWFDWFSYIVTSQVCVSPVETFYFSRDCNLTTCITSSTQKGQISTKAAHSVGSVYFYRIFFIYSVCFLFLNVMKEACSAAKVIFTIPIYQQIEQQACNVTKTLPPRCG